MPTLNLGVVDIAYTDDGKTTTTGDVATYIENEYHVMQVFLESHEEEIGNFLANAMAGEIESLAQGRPVVPLAKKGVTTKLGDRVIKGASVNGRIEEAFRDYLDSREWERTSGKTVAAAVKGINHRKKKPNARANSARPAFVDTGLYQASFRAWLTDD